MVVMSWPAAVCHMIDTAMKTGDAEAFIKTQTCQRERRDEVRNFRGCKNRT